MPSWERRKEHNQPFRHWEIYQGTGSQQRGRIDLHANLA
jgi:hypothetical protein